MCRTETISLGHIFIWLGRDQIDTITSSNYSTSQTLNAGYECIVICIAVWSCGTSLGIDSRIVIESQLAPASSNVLVGVNISVVVPIGLPAFSQRSNVIVSSLEVRIEASSVILGRRHCWHKTIVTSVDPTVVGIGIVRTGRIGLINPNERIGPSV